MKDPWQIQFEARRREREEADRTLKIEGFDEVLVFKPSIPPEVAFRFYDLDRRLSEFSEARADAARTGAELPDPAGVRDSDVVDLSEATIRACLEDASLPEWEKMRSADHPNPLTILDLHDFARFLLAKASGLPTGGPADSSAGPTANGSSSAAGLSSAAERPKRSRSRTG